MSMLMRRSLLRAIPRNTRGFAAAAGEGSYAEKQAALKAHAGGMFCVFGYSGGIVFVDGDG